MIEKTLIFFKKRKIGAILFLIIFLGAFLRLYNFHDLVRFNNDQVRDSKIVDEMIEKKNFPLLGPPAAASDFKLGPAYYYLAYSSAIIFGNNPAGIAYLIAVLSIASIPLLFVFLRYYFSAYVSLALTFFYSISFFMIKYSKFTWNPNFIPFFLLIFLISLFKIYENKSERNWLWFILAGIAMGVGFQLHTFLIFILPALLIFLWAFAFMREKRKIIANFISVFIIAIILNSTVIASDFTNGGKNFQSFFSVANERSVEKFSLINNFFDSIQFFVQGNTYVLSGFELRDAWLSVSKTYLKMVDQPAVAILGSLFFIFCLARAIIDFRKEIDGKKKLFLGIALSTLALSFLLFLFVSGMLKARFFIAIFFVSFVFLGIFIKFIFGKFSKKKALAMLTLIAIVLSVYNFFIYHKAYDLDNYAGKSDLYGGISLKEASDISEYIVGFSKSETLAEKKLYLDNFDFSQSVEYLNKKSEIETEVIKNRKKINSEFILFKVVKSKNEEQAAKEEDGQYAKLETKNLGRFSVLIFENAK